MGNKILVGSNFVGTKNRIINGGFRVWQRGTSFTFSGGNYGYTTDRIRTQNNTDGEFAVEKSEINGINSIKFSVNTPPTDLSSTNYWYGLGYVFEGQHLYDLVINKENITISFIFKSNVTGTYNISLRNFTLDDNGVRNFDSFVTEFEYTEADIPQKIEVTIPLDFEFQNPPKNDENIGFYLTIGFLNQGDYVTSTTNQWQNGNYITTPNCVNWGASAGNYIEIAQLQLEKGSYATEFEVVPYDVELERCMRYYEIININTDSVAHPKGVCVSPRDANGQAILPVKVKKRANPTVLFNVISVQNGVGTTISVSAISCSDNGITSITTSSSMDNSVPYHIVVDAGGYIKLDAEL